MKRPIVPALILAVLLAGGIAAAAQPPEQVAADYLEALRARGFAAQADFLLPEEMERFRDMLMPAFEHEEAGRGRALLNATFGREATPLAVRLADPAEVVRRFARVMSVRMPEQPTGYDELVVLGTLAEGETAHVLARLRTVAGDQTRERLQVVSLRPWGETWRVLMSPELEEALRGMGNPGGRPQPRLVPEPPPAESSPGAAGAER
jgi:hypothetical protein